MVRVLSIWTVVSMVNWLEVSRLWCNQFPDFLAAWIVEYILSCESRETLKHLEAQNSRRTKLPIYHMVCTTVSPDSSTYMHVIPGTYFHGPILGVLFTRDI